MSVQAPNTATTTSTLSAVSTTQDSPETISTAVTTESAETSTSRVSTPLATLVKRLFDAFAGDSPSEPAAASPLAWVLAAASRREFASAAAETTNPTMVLNGYHVVAIGEPPYVGSFYGMFTNFPGFQGVVQGEQDFDLVDPR